VQEIDGAAKDVKHTNFDQDFSLEVFWKYIPDAVGTGEALAAQVAEAPQVCYISRPSVGLLASAYRGM